MWDDETRTRMTKIRRNTETNKKKDSESKKSSSKLCLAYLLLLSVQLFDTTFHISSNWCLYNSGHWYLGYSPQTYQTVKRLQNKLFKEMDFWTNMYYLFEDVNTKQY